MLALYTTKGITPEVNFGECISHMPLPSVNKAEPTLALKSRRDVTRSLKQGYQWPHKWTCVPQFVFLKKSLNFIKITHIGMWISNFMIKDVFTKFLLDLEKL